MLPKMFVLKVSNAICKFIKSKGKSFFKSSSSFIFFGYCITEYIIYTFDILSRMLILCKSEVKFVSCIFNNSSLYRLPVVNIVKQNQNESTIVIKNTTRKRGPATIKGNNDHNSCKESEV